MSNDKQTLTLRGDREIVLTRRFSAPRHLVWKAHSSCEHLKHWWGPKGWDLVHCMMDFRPNGTWHYCMAGEYEGNAMESWGLATYQEIEEPERIVYTDAFSDKEGSINPDMPEMLITVTMDDQGETTLLTNVTRCESAEARQQLIDMGMEGGITETWDRLDELLTQLDPTEASA